jgi:hypothetical protein
MERHHEIDAAARPAHETCAADRRMGAAALIAVLLYGAAAGALIGFLIGRAV